MDEQNRETDVVAGSGLAGLVLALRALEAEADVIVLEKGYRIGGNTPITEGTFAEKRPVGTKRVTSTEKSLTCSMRIHTTD